MSTKFIIQSLSILIFILHIKWLNAQPLYTSYSHVLGCSPTENGSLITEGSVEYNHTNISSCQIIQDAAQVNYKACQSICLNPGFSIHNLTSGNFSAYVNTNALDIAWVHDPTIYSNYTPWEGFTNERVELGLALSNELQQKINNFLDVSTTNNSGSINPYDPFQIKVRIDFTNTETNTTLKRYGYYYVAFDENSATNDLNRIDNPYPFRVRAEFSRPGDWQFHVYLIVNNETIAGESEGTIKIKSGTGWGHLKIGTYQKQLTYEAGANENYAIKPFFAVGVSLGNDPYVPMNLQLANRWKNIMKYKDINFTRVRMDPWAYGIEWEQLGVYGSDIDNYGRQKRAYYLDKLINTVDKSMSQYILLCLEYDGNFATQTAYPTVQPYLWDNNPYKTLGSINDFFTNQTIIDQYQKKLFYIVSRWGYSSNVVWQIFNETNGIEGGVTPEVYTWITDKALSLKTFNSNYLVTTGFADTQEAYPNHPYNPNNSITIDFRMSNTYGTNKELNESRYDKMDRQLSQGILKPFLFGEMGMTDCGPAPDQCNFAEFHNAVWSTAMTGSMGCGQYWYDAENGLKHMDLEGLNLFMRNVPFETNNFSGYYWDDNDKIEAFYSVNETGSKGFGWIHNKDFNWANDPNFTSNCNACSYIQNATFGTAPNYILETKLSHFQSFKDYIVEIYAINSPTTMYPSIVQTKVVNSGLSGRVKFTQPLAGKINGSVLGSYYDPDYAITVYKQEQTFKNSAGSYNSFYQSENDVYNEIATFHENKILENDTLMLGVDNLIEFKGKIDANHEKYKMNWDFGNGKSSTEHYPVILFEKAGVYPVELTYQIETGESYTVRQNFVVLDSNSVDSKQDYVIHPNPSIGKFIVSLPEEMQGTIKLYNMLGVEILSEDLQSNKIDYTFDLSTYTNGVYLVNVVTPQGIMNKRIILDRLSID